MRAQLGPVPVNGLQMGSVAQGWHLKFANREGTKLNVNEIRCVLSPGLNHVAMLRQRRRR